MMKRFVFVLAVCFAVALLAVSCGKKETHSVVGCWQLESLETRASVGDVEVDIYVSFASDKSFELYQMVGEGRYRRFTGSYSLTGKVLDGTYSDGSKWGSSYEVEFGKGIITLSSIPVSESSASEISTYISIPSIPDSVLSRLH